MKREEVVGRRITRLMRDDVIIEQGKPPLPGISSGIYRFFHVFAELDNRDLVEVGLDRRYYPLKFVSNDIREQLTDLTLPEEVRGCIGETITEVLAVHEEIILRLSSGRYFWVEDALEGTVVCVQESRDVPEEALRNYWEEE